LNAKSYLGLQFAGLHLGLFVVVTELSGPICGKNLLCWYAVSSSFLNEDWMILLLLGDHFFNPPG
jgi:hypothetical protein